MLYLDDTLPEIVKAQVEHINAVTCRINKKIYNTPCADAKCKICNSTQKARTPSATVQRLAVLLARNGILNLVLAGKPDKLIRLSTILWKQLVPGFTWAGYDQYASINNKDTAKRSPAERLFHAPYNNAVNAFKVVFEYNTWFSGDDKDKYDAYTLAMNLNRNTCTYCNRIYTHTVERVKGSKVMRPQFDHWFSKSKHPALSMSFYNLIPSCSVCNSSIKGTLDFGLSTHLHPYIDVDCHDKFIYSYKYNKSSRRYNVSITSSNPLDLKIAQTYNDLKLKEVFDTHHAELADLLKIKKAYSTKYINKMIASFPLMHLSYKEVYRLAFGAEFDGSDFYKRPLSKFKKDILKELKLVR